MSNEAKQRINTEEACNSSEKVLKVHKSCSERWGMTVNLHYFQSVRSRTDIKYVSSLQLQHSPTERIIRSRNETHNDPTRGNIKLVAAQNLKRDTPHREALGQSIEIRILNFAIRKRQMLTERHKYIACK